MLTTLHQGRYDNLCATYERLQAYAAAHGFKSSAATFSRHE